MPARDKAEPASMILVVDDDRGLSRLVEKALEREGFATASASSFEDAVEWLAHHRPDLMLLDLKLHQIGGKELVDHLAGQGQSVPFIIITGQGDERMAVAMMKRGALDYLVKDADFLEHVPAAVQRVMRQLDREKKLSAAEEALRSSQANLAKAQEIAHLGSYELNIPWSEQDYRSEEVFRILGLDPERREFAIRNYVDQLVHPADRQQYRQVIERSVREAAPFDFEYRIARPDGTIRTVQSVGEPVLDQEGRVVKLVGTLLDITERKRAEEAFRREHAFTSAILDTSAALVVVLDRLGRIVRFNRACERITGKAAAEVKGKAVWDLFLAPEEAAAVRPVFERLVTGQAPNRHETRWRSGTGESRLIAWSNSALQDDNGSVEYVISVGIDVTEHRRLEQEILQISELEQRRIGQDLHDGLCQHLAAVELMSQILAQNLERRSKADAARASEVARQVREAISQTRLLARGLSPVVLESEGLMSALEDLSENTQKMFRISCRFECDRPVLVDDHRVATHLYRIAQEAVSNAIRHGKAKKVRLALSSRCERMLLTVEDDGTGIPPDPGKAKGMGLRIMQYRAGMIGGLLRLERLPAGGTRVSCAIEKKAEVNPAQNHGQHKRTEASEG